MGKKIIIAGISVRSYVQAAATTGYEVIAIDAFGDADTRAAAARTYTVDYAQSGFDPVNFAACLAAIDTGKICGFAYVGGFDASADLLEAVARDIPLLGNSPKVVRNLKRPLQFFTLLDILGIAHPEISLKPLESAAGWLYKQGGGTGGTHIRKALPLAGIKPQTGWYFQREAAGVPVSLLFAADGLQIRVLGFNWQWLSPSAAMPYRYGGAVSNVELPEAARQQLIYAAQQLTLSVGLRGLNSVDAMLDGDRVLVLEINPRLSATFDLYRSADCNPFDLHVKACARDISGWPPLPTSAKAHHIIYAPYRLKLPDVVQWPQWVADVPPPGSMIEADSPLCTLFAEADNAKAALELMTTRTDLIAALLENYRIDF